MFSVKPLSSDGETRGKTRLIEGTIGLRSIKEQEAAKEARECLNRLVSTHDIDTTVYEAEIVTLTIHRLGHSYSQSLSIS